MKFELVIAPAENDTVTRSRLDIVYLIDQVSRRLRNNTELKAAEIRDATGDLVGWWRIEDDDVTPISMPPLITGD